MGSKYKAALIPRRIRETIHGWGKATRKKRRRRRGAGDDSTVRTETSTVCSLTDEDEDDFDDHHHHGPFEETPTAARAPPFLKIELQHHGQRGGGHGPVRAGTPCFHPASMPGSSSTHGGGSGHPMLTRQSSSASAPSSPSYRGGNVTRSASMPGIASLRTGAFTPTRMSHEGHDESTLDT
nr:unnamed protein product [Digitaria exilis]